jgi:glycosyltransferase involved in cell wall biosynthesis
LNVLVVIFERLLPISGGGTPRFRKMIDILVERGHNVTVAAAFNIKVEETKRLLNCKEVIYLKDARFTTNNILRYIIYSIINTVLILKASLHIKPDLVITNNSIAGLSGVILRKLVRCTLAINIGDLLFEYLYFYYNSVSWAKYLHRIGRVIEIKIIKKSDVIITVSKYMKHVLIKRGVSNEKIYVIYDGVDINLFKPKIKEGNKIRRKYAPKMNDVIMFHGGISPQDSLEVIVQAANNVLKIRERTSFWIIGEGSSRTKLMKDVESLGINKHFFFSGWVPHETIPNYISACDIGLVILPNSISSETKVTLKTFEYWACEKPIIISDLKAPREVVLPGKNGLFYRAEDPQDLSIKICSLLEDKILMKQMGINGRKTVEDKYYWNDLVSNLVDICEDIHYSKTKAKK